MLEWDHLRTRTKLQKAGVEEIGVFGKRSWLGRREFLIPNDADTFLLSFFQYLINRQSGEFIEY